MCHCVVMRSIKWNACDYLATSVNALGIDLQAKYIFYIDHVQDKRGGEWGRGDDHIVGPNHNIHRPSEGPIIKIKYAI